MYIHAHGGLPNRLLWNIDGRFTTLGRFLRLGNIDGCGRLGDGRLLGSGGLPNRNRRGMRRGQQTQTQWMHFFGHNMRF